MTDKEWFELWDKTHEEFEWFFMLYNYGQLYQDLEWFRKNENRDMMLTIMNHVWFKLPDSRFNIIENPKGWSEFLTLIEE